MVLQFHVGATSGPAGASGPAGESAPRSDGERLARLGRFTVMLFAAGFAATAAAAWLASLLG